MLVYKHAKVVKSKVTLDNFVIIGTSSRGENYLLTLEAIWIKELNPAINTREEYKTRELSIRLLSGLLISKQFF